MEKTNLAAGDSVDVIWNDEPMEIYNGETVNRGDRVVTGTYQGETKDYYKVNMFIDSECYTTMYSKRCYVLKKVEKEN